MNSVVLLSLFNLWGHVGHSASVGAQRVDLAEGREAEVSHFQIHVIVDKNVFQLQVSVNNPLAVHVLEHLEHLVQEETTTVLAHTAEGLADVEEKPTCDVFEQDVDQVFNLTA